MKDFLKKRRKLMNKHYKTNKNKKKLNKIYNQFKMYITVTMIDQQEVISKQLLQMPGMINLQVEVNKRNSSNLMLGMINLQVESQIILGMNNLQEEVIHYYLN